MKIALVKQECQNGDKASIAGKVAWIGEIKQIESSQGDFCVQSLLVADGPQTADKANSIFCDFNTDKGGWDQYKNRNISLRGTVNIYGDKISLRSCRPTKAQAPQPAPQAASGGQQATKDEGVDKKGVDWDAKDLRMARMCGLKNATALVCLLAEMTQNDASLNIDHIKGVAADFVDYIYNGVKLDDTRPDWMGPDPKPLPALDNSAESLRDQEEDDIPF